VFVDAGDYAAFLDGQPVSKEADEIIRKVGDISEVFSLGYVPELANDGGDGELLRRAVSASWRR
jgi:hypothetical protein